MRFRPEYPQLTPAMRSVLERMARAKYPPMYTQSPEEAKAAYEAGSGVLEVPKATLARVEDFTIPAGDGTRLPARLYAPGEEVLPVLLYFHGGGFTIGSIASHDILCRELTRLSGCAVVSLEYRLAPEHRFPTAVDDAWDATRWLAANGKPLRLDTGRLAVGGDSAGGTLAAVCAILARDHRLPVALQLLFYPGCAAWQDAPSHERFATGLVLERAHIEWFFDQYIDPARRTDWRFAPALAADHEGVAPACIVVAECDALVDEAVAYGDILRAAGVVVDLEIWRGVTHDFIKMGRVLPEAAQAQQSIADALKKAFE